MKEFTGHVLNNRPKGRAGNTGGLGGDDRLYFSHPQGTSADGRTEVEILPKTGRRLGSLRTSERFGWSWTRSGLVWKSCKELQPFPT